jgi:hypothetical protein
VLPSDLRLAGRRFLHPIRRLMEVLEARYVVRDRFRLGRSMSSSRSMKRLKVIWKERGIG